MGDRGAAATQKIADVVADTMVKARTALAGHEAATKRRATEGMMEDWERNLSEFAAPFFKQFLESDEIPDDHKDLLRSLTATGHQTDFLINILTAFMSIFSIASAVQAGNIDKWRAWGYSHVPERRPDLAMLVEGVIKGALTGEQGEQAAREIGFIPEWFRKFVEITGNPPGPQELLQAYRRGIIDKPRLEHGIRQSNIKNEWIDVVEALRYSPPGAATAIEAAVQNQLTPAEALQLAEEAGLDPHNFGWMYQLAGNPPGNEHMIDLMHRGAMSRAEVEQGLRESRLKNKYIAPMIDGGYHLPPMRTVIALGRKGLLTSAQVTEKLLNLGFKPEDAAVMAAESTADKVAGEKDIARAQVVDGYMERLHTRAEAAAMLGDLGYDGQEAAFLLDLADHARQRRFTDSAVSRFHTLFVRWKIDRLTASTSLDALGVPAAQRDDLLKLWDLERSADAPGMTAAQWGGLLRRGVIDPARHRSEVMKLGYDNEEAEFLATLAFPASTR